MTEPSQITMVRKIDHLERQVRHLETIQNGYSLGDVIGSFQSLPFLRGLWVAGGSAFESPYNLADFSEQNRTLTNNGAVTYGVLSSGMPFATYNGTTQYHSRADEAGLDIGFTLIIGGWFYWSTAAPSGRLMGKWAAAPQSSYLLDLFVETSGLFRNIPRFIVSVDGTATTIINSTVFPAYNTWNFVVGRFLPSTEVSIFVNGTKATNTTSIPATIFNSTSAFALMAQSGGATFMAGRASICFLSIRDPGDAVIDRLFQMSRAYYGV